MFAETDASDAMVIAQNANKCNMMTIIVPLGIRERRNMGKIQKKHSLGPEHIQKD